MEGSSKSLIILRQYPLITTSTTSINDAGRVGRLPPCPQPAYRQGTSFHLPAPMRSGSRFLTTVVCNAWYGDTCPNGNRCFPGSSQTRGSASTASCCRDRVANGAGLGRTLESVFVWGGVGVVSWLHANADPHKQAATYITNHGGIL